MPANATLTPLLTAPEVAALLRCSVDRVWRYQRAGLLRATRVVPGARLKFTQAEVERFIAAGSDDGEAA